MKAQSVRSFAVKCVGKTPHQIEMHVISIHARYPRARALSTPLQAPGWWLERMGTADPFFTLMIGEIQQWRAKRWMVDGQVQHSSMSRWVSDGRHDSRSEFYDGRTYFYEKLGFREGVQNDTPTSCASIGFPLSSSVTRLKPVDAEHPATSTGSRGYRQPRVPAATGTGRHGYRQPRAPATTSTGSHGYQQTWAKERCQQPSSARVIQ